MKPINECIAEYLTPFDGKIYQDLINRTLYATDASMFQLLPQLAIEPASTEDLRKIIKLAKERNIPIAARGAGTGLAGESLTQGIVLDFSVSMNKIIGIDSEKSTVTVQPGVVLGELNKQLAPLGKLFGPDPATANRCTIGGIIANNSTGAHSLRYGMTNDWLQSITVMLDDGSIETFKAENHSQKYEGRKKEIYQKLRPLLQNNLEKIKSIYPKTPRNRHGYLIDKILDGETIDLAQLFCASEGTLGLIIEAELKVADLPAANQLIYLTFNDRLHAAAMTPHLLTFNPSAVEIIDNVCLDMARSREIYAQIFPAEINSILLVELDGESMEEINQKIEKIKELEKQQNDFPFQVHLCQNAQERETIWKMRKLIAGMINKVPGKYQPVPIIEDVCVDPHKLAEYFMGIEKILSSYNLKYLCFGHAGGGTVHIRPFLDLKSDETYKWLPQMCNEVYDLTMKLKGTISGEHGDGFLRAPFIKKQYRELFDLFVDIKNIFDPQKIFNPDKKTGMPGFEPWKRYLRYGGNYRPRTINTNLNWASGKIQEIVEACNGCGQCRSKLKDSDMCPMFRRYGTEISSTRAKANIMRNLICGNLDQSSMQEILEVANYCINCKMCEADCPSNVAAGDLMLELKTNLKQSMETMALTNMEKGLELGSKFPQISNFLAKRKEIKYLLDKTAGISAKRTTPQLSCRPFIHNYKKNISKGANDKVIYFVDTFANLINTPVAEAFCKIMSHNNIEVIIPPQKGCGIVQLNYGQIKQAKKIAQYNVKHLLPYIEQGYKIVCTEPSAALMLSHEYPLLCDDDNFKKVAQNVIDASTYLWQLSTDKKLKTDFCEQKYTVGYHRPCHLKALNPQSPSMELLKLIPGLQVEFIDEGCCGMAGTFGMRNKGMESSLIIGKNLIKKVNNPAIDHGVTECSTCKLQMDENFHKKITFHVVEIIAQAYNRTHGRG